VLPEIRSISPSRIIEIINPEQYSYSPKAIEAMRRGREIHKKIIGGITEEGGEFVSIGHPKIARILNQYPSRPLIAEKKREVSVDPLTHLSIRPDLVLEGDLCAEIKPSPKLRHFLQVILGQQATEAEKKERMPDGALYFYRNKGIALVKAKSIGEETWQQVTNLTIRAAELHWLDQQEKMLKRREGQYVQALLGPAPLTMTEIKQGKVKCRRDIDGIFENLSGNLARIAREAMG